VNYIIYISHQSVSLVILFFWFVMCSFLVWSGSCLFSSSTVSQSFSLYQDARNSFG
jgi:Ni,Fe-hydrogenase I cytochrome b subunit